MLSEIESDQEKRYSSSEVKFVDFRDTVPKPSIYLEKTCRLSNPIGIHIFGQQPVTALRVLGKIKQSSENKKKEPTIQPTVKKISSRRWRKSLKVQKTSENVETEEKKTKEVKNFRSRSSSRGDASAVKKESQSTKKIKCTMAKPKAVSRTVNVKKTSKYETLNFRFVHCCYRVCCQCYCYLTTFLVIGFVVLLVL